MKSECKDRKESEHFWLHLEKCLKELLQEEGECAATASADWLEAMDRGGLVHVH